MIFGTVRSSRSSSLCLLHLSGANQSLKLSQSLSQVLSLKFPLKLYLKLSSSDSIALNLRAYSYQKDTWLKTCVQNFYIYCIYLARVIFISITVFLSEEKISCLMLRECTMCCCCHHCCCWCCPQLCSNTPMCCLCCKSLDYLQVIKFKYSNVKIYLLSLCLWADLTECSSLFPKHSLMLRLTEPDEETLNQKEIKNWI